MEKYDKKPEKTIEDYIRDIQAQQQEIDRLKVELNDIKILKMAMENGKIDMTIESPKAKLFLASIVQIFRQNGAKNYYTVDLRDAETNESFSVTIQNNKGLSSAQILNEKDKQITALTLDKDEQTEQMKYLLRRTIPVLEVTNDQQGLIDAINALLGGKEDA